MRLEKFDIRKYVDRLRHAGPEANRYYCPVCEGNDLTVNTRNGAYTCHHGCGKELVREAIKPLAEVFAEVRSETGGKYQSLAKISNKHESITTLIRVESQAEGLMRTLKAGDISEAGAGVAMAAWAKAEGLDVFAATQLMKERIREYKASPEFKRAKSAEERRKNRAMKLAEVDNSTSSYGEDGQLGRPIRLVPVLKGGVEVDSKLPEHSAVAAYLIGSQGGLIGQQPNSERDEVFLYSSTTGLMEKANRKAIGRKVIELFTYCYGAMGEDDWSDRLSANYIKGCTDLILTKVVALPALDAPPTEYLPLANGVLRLADLELFSYREMADQGVVFTYKSVLPYEPGAQCPEFHQFLDGVLGSSSKDLLQAVMFATLTSQHSHKFSVELVGPRDCGKSVLQRLMVEVFGGARSPVIAAADYGKLMNPEKNFAMGALHGKKLVIVPDTKGYVGPCDRYKQLTSGGDFIEGENKFGHSFTFQFKGIIWTAGNAKIKFADDDEATRSRRIIFQFLRTVPQEQRKVLLEVDGHNAASGAFAEELGGILSWILDGTGTYKSQIEAAKDSATKSASLAIEGSTIGQWMMENVAVGEGLTGVIGNDRTIGGLYAHYRTWCDTTGHRSTNVDRFLQEFLSLISAYQQVCEVKVANNWRTRRKELAGASLIDAVNGTPDPHVLNVGFSITGDRLKPD
jgi:phage/plasmid-associated DNA primase